MAAPTPTARTTPTGFFLQDGYRTLVTLALDPAIQFWEKTLKPPGVDVGEMIPETTMFNNFWRTFAFRKLRTLTDGDVKAAYDPNVLSLILSAVGYPTTVTYHFPTNASICYYGGISKFMPDEVEEGKQPEATITLPATNWDYSANVEAGPVYTPAGGTS